ncbi:MAG: hypothetical protein ACLSC6_07050, partial [Anaerobutyricum hallii]
PIFVILLLRVGCSPPGLHSILAKATNIGYLFFAKLKVLSSLTKTEIKRPPIYKKCALEQALNADEH